MGVVTSYTQGPKLKAITLVLWTGFLQTTRCLNSESQGFLEKKEFRLSTALPAPAWVRAFWFQACQPPESREPVP